MPARSCSAANAATSAWTPKGACRSATSTCRWRNGLSACPSTIPSMCHAWSTCRRASGCASNVRPRGEGGGAAREGAALLQGILRCGRCGRRMQVGYAGTDGKVRRYACVRGHLLHATDQTCQSLGGGRLDQAVAAAFLDAVTPAGIAATARAVRELHDQHDARLAGQRLALERAEFEADRARRQFDACEPEHRLVARTLERTLEDALAAVERERGRLAALEQARPAPLTDSERDALVRLARDLPRLWKANTTTDRDRKELLRALISEVIVTVNAGERRAAVEICWEGGV